MSHDDYQTIMNHLFDESHRLRMEINELDKISPLINSDTPCNFREMIEHITKRIELKAKEQQLQEVGRFVNKFWEARK